MVFFTSEKYANLFLKSLFSKVYFRNFSLVAVMKKDHESTFLVKLSVLKIAHIFLRHTLLYSVSNSAKLKFSLAFLHIEFHFYPSLQTSYDATCHIESYFEDPPKIDNFFPSQHFQFFTKKWGNENVAMGKNCEFLADVQNRTQYDRWHQKKSVEMDQSESQYIKKPEK